MYYSYHGQSPRSKVTSDNQLCSKSHFQQSYIAKNEVINIPLRFLSHNSASLESHPKQNKESQQVQQSYIWKWSN